MQVAHPELLELKQLMAILPRGGSQAGAGSAPLGNEGAVGVVLEGRSEKMNQASRQKRELSVKIGRGGSS